MAVPERDTVYTTDDGLNRTTTTYTRESSATGWFVGIIVALALLAIGYLVFSANSGPSTSTTTVNNTPAIAPFPLATMIDIGVASPSAHGQAMINTATALMIACAIRGSGPMVAHTIAVTMASATTIGTK